MGRKLIWSPRALEDLETILAWIERDSPSYARTVGTRFFSRAEGLTDHPGQGRRIPEYRGGEECREVFVHSWRLMYRVRESEIAIVAIVHGARLFSRARPFE